MSTGEPSGTAGAADAQSEKSAVVDDREKHRFIFEAEGAVGVLEYREEANQLYLVHTEVPEALAGRGIAGMLVKAALMRAARDGFEVVPECSYARHWLEAHADVAERVAINWG